jgi:hypothetical protein
VCPLVCTCVCLGESSHVRGCIQNIPVRRCENRKPHHWTLVKTAHFHSATCNLAHWLTGNCSPTIYRCFALQQLLYRWRRQSRIFWIHPRMFGVDACAFWRREACVSAVAWVTGLDWLIWVDVQRSVIGAAWYVILDIHLCVSVSIGWSVIGANWCVSFGVEWTV